MQHLVTLMIGVMKMMNTKEIIERSELMKIYITSKNRMIRYYIELTNRNKK